MTAPRLHRSAGPGPLIALAFPGTRGDVILPADLGPALRACLRGWTPVERPLRRRAPAPQNPVSLVAGSDDGLFIVGSPRLEQPLDGLAAASAVCAVIADLVEDLIDSDPRLSGLHCAAFRRGTGPVVVLTGPARAGKSTLIARLSAEPGVSVLCDDVLPVDGRGLALGLGVAPRLRLPLPVRVPRALHDHVTRHLGLRDESYGYLELPGLVPHGNRAPVGTVIGLCRRSGAQARLHRMDAGAAIRLLAAQTIGGLGDDPAAMARASTIATAAGAATLVYDDLDAAVDLLWSAMGADGRLRPDADLAPPLPDAAAPPAPPPGAALRRASGVVLRRRRGGLVLGRPGHGPGWQINTAGRMIWSLLEETHTPAEIIETLSAAFPETPRTAIAADVGAFLGAMSQGGLVNPAQGPD